MAPNLTYNLPLTAAQAEQVLRLVSIGEPAIAEHNRTGLLPGGLGDATLMRSYLQGLRGAPSLEKPMRDLATWVKKAEA